MSNYCVEWLKQRQLGIGGAAKAVIFLLADHANGAGVAWPSVATLVRESEFSRRHVQDALAKGLKLGLFRMERRMRENGSHRSNAYVFQLTAISAPKLGDYDFGPDEDGEGAGGAGGGACGAPPLVHVAHHPGARGAPLEPSLNPQKEPQGNLVLDSNESNMSDLVEKLFKQAWSDYPQKGRERSSKDKARRAWVIASGKCPGGAEALANAVLRYSDDPDALKSGGQFVPAFDRWLRDDRWEHHLFRKTNAFGVSEAQQEMWVREWKVSPELWREWDRGPAPGVPGCRIDPEILRRNGFAALCRRWDKVT